MMKTNCSGGKINASAHDMLFFPKREKIKTEDFFFVQTKYEFYFFLFSRYIITITNLSIRLLLKIRRFSTIYLKPRNKKC